MAATAAVAARARGDQRGIRVNAISPGGIVTGIFAKSAGLEGSKADKVTDVVRPSAADPARRETIDIVLARLSWRAMARAS
jgi:NAD(P)-dependent dehydrogenase (short-subunit alcohol dehydrogenase family)